VRSSHTARCLSEIPATIRLARGFAFSCFALSFGLVSCGGKISPDPMPDGGPSEPCTTSGLFCDRSATLLRDCKDGFAETVVDCGSLGQMCSNNRCVDPTCYELELKPSGAKGCLFHAVGLSNLVADAGETQSLLVTNASGVPANVELQRLMPDGPRSWGTVARETVMVTSSHRFRAPFAALAIDDKNPRVAVRIESDQPVTVVQIESDDADEGATNSAGTMLLPVNSLGRRHRLMAYPQHATAAVAAVGGGEGPGRVVVIGIERGTKVTYTPSGPSEPSQEVDIDEGDVVQFWSETEGQDLTGSIVEGTKRIAVLSGNLTTTYGRDVADVVSSPDMTLEQMLPLIYWSRTYVAAALPPQASTCDGLLEVPGASVWRLTTDHPGTTVEFDGPEGADLPAPFTMDAGQVRELIVQDASFTIRASEPVMVMQGMDCEPSLSPAVPVDQLLTDLYFPVLPNFAQMIAVVRPRDSIPVTIDNNAIDNFVPAGRDYEVAQVEIASCPADAGVCTHHLQGLFGVTLRGMDIVCSYALTVPTWRGCDPTDPLFCNQ
jgi:hypothetical protein